MVFLCVHVCVCVLQFFGFVILGFGLNWVWLNRFVCGKYSLISVPTYTTFSAYQQISLPKKKKKKQLLH